MTTIGERIAYYRTKLGMTQKELGKHLNVSPQAVSKWEKGSAEPDLSTIKNMSAHFGTTLDELINGRDDAGVAAGIA